jgi:hypothetical protein
LRGLTKQSLDLAIECRDVVGLAAGQHSACRTNDPAKSFGIAASQGL